MIYLPRRRIWPRALFLGFIALWLGLPFWPATALALAGAVWWAEGDRGEVTSSWTRRIFDITLASRRRA